MHSAFRIPLIPCLLAGLAVPCVAQTSQEDLRIGLPIPLAADLQTPNDFVLQLAVMPAEQSAESIATTALGGQYLQLKEQAPSLTNTRRTLLERQLNGYPVHGEVVRVNRLADGTTLLVGGVSDIHSWSGVDSLGIETAHEIARGTFGAHVPSQISAQRIEILPLLGGARLCHRLDIISSASTSIAYRVWVDAENGFVWQIENRAVHQNGQAAVFMPNPVETLDNPNLSDQHDSGTAVPSAAYFQVVLEDLDGSGFLTGDWATTAATPNRSFRANLDFRNDRQGRIFEEALSYYHVTTLQHRLQALGLTARRSAQNINVVDRFFGFEYANASYNPSTGVISFGTKNVDFAEDADVVIHEYGHSIHDDVQGGLAGGFGSNENGSMSEGYGDWLAAVHSDDVMMGEWVDIGLGGGSGGAFPGIRRVDGMKHYPEDKRGEVHDDGEIWAAALWEIGLMIGHDEAIQLVVEGMSMMTRNTFMQRAAELLVIAEGQLTGGADSAYVIGPLLRTGLLDTPVGTPLLEANRRGIRSGDLLGFQITSPTHSGNSYQVVLSKVAAPTATGSPFNTTLDIGVDLLAWSLLKPEFQGILDSNGSAAFTLTVPQGLPWKSTYFAQAMVLDSGNIAIAQSMPIALRAERH